MSMCNCLLGYELLYHVRTAFDRSEFAGEPRFMSHLQGRLAPKQILQLPNANEWPRAEDLVSLQKVEFKSC